MAVGVLIPVHGFAPYLAEAIDSVLAAAPAQVVVVDDGSPSPLTLAASHVARVTLIRRATPGGPAAARAAGLEALGASVDLVALCDADDAWEEGKLAAQERALAAHPGAGWSFGRARVVGPDGRLTGERWAEPAGGLHRSGVLGPALYAANPVPTSSVMLRRAALEQAGGFPGPVRVAEDWELWLRLCRTGADAVCEPAAVVRYRRHPGGLTSDVAGLARAQAKVHELHRALVGEGIARDALAADQAALAAGLARAGDRAGSREAWNAAAALRPLSGRDRARRLAGAVPFVGGLVGRRDPYRR